MIAVFYDRRNKREVTSEQLMPINYVRHILTIDEDGYGCEEWKPESQPAFVTEEKIGEFGYRSPACQSACNFDLTVVLSDLVFLRLEEPKP